MKIWQIKGIDDKFNEEELIDMIRNNKVKKGDILLNTELNLEAKVEETIYSFYMRNKEDE